MSFAVETSDSIVVAVGGNALIDPKSRGTLAEQKETTRVTMRAVARLIAAGHRVVITHGNGPIVGNIVIRNEAASDRIPPMPLDVCVADSCGGIGYMVQQILANELLALGVERSVITLITQVEVDLADPAFQRPTKPIGPFYRKEEVDVLRREKRWNMIEDSGRGWRRVVPSPKPVRIVEGELVRSLVETGAVVIAVGGGGIPVRRDADGRLEGVEAVVDKDRAAVLLARDVGATILAVITAVPKVAIRFGKPDQRNLDRLSLAEAKTYHEAGEFPAGSMGPKIESAIRFLEGGGRGVLVTSVSLLLEGITGRDGTWIVPGAP
ncbi:MAG: carbamate kinase [Candidatus Eisenbacteria bacterium]